MRHMLGASLMAMMACTTAVTAAEPENPYPYGKAEIRAREITDVVVLLRTGNQYRDRCLRLISCGRSQGEVEQAGREAKSWYRAALEQEPSNAYASLCIGYVDLTLGRATSDKRAKEDMFSSALARFREALENRPGYAKAHLYIAQIYALTERYAEAEKKLRLILDSSIEDSQIHAWMAFVMLRTDRPSQAQRHLARSIELDDPSQAAKWSRDRQ